MNQLPRLVKVTWGIAAATIGATSVHIYNDVKSVNYLSYPDVDRGTVNRFTVRVKKLYFGGIYKEWRRPLGCDMSNEEFIRFATYESRHPLVSYFLRLIKHDQVLPMYSYSRLEYCLSLD